MTASQRRIILTTRDNPNDPHSTIDDSCQIINSFVKYAHIDEDCEIINSYICGLPEQPIHIGKNSKIIDCHLVASEKTKNFQFASWSISSPQTSVGKHCSLIQSYINNSSIDDHCDVIRSSINHSEIKAHCTLRPHTNLILTSAAPYTHIGSEISKSILAGQGFTSEHTASYLSLIAPSTYPIIDHNGQEKLLEHLPNLSNIGAGTVFANYSGQPKTAISLEKSSGSQKGTAIVYGTFTAVNSVIVNKYGQPPKDITPFEILRQKDITILGLGSFVEKKVTGRIPAFSLSSDTSASKMKIGWVLDQKPGILLNLLKKMKKQLKKETFRLEGLIEGTIRLEIQLLKEQLTSPYPWTKEQLLEGITIFEQNLDGRWHIDKNGELTKTWFFDHQTQNWTPPTH